MSDVLRDARTLIERQLSAIDDEEQRLRRALSHLDGDHRRRGGRPQRSGSGTTQKRAGRGERRRQFFDAVAGKPGISVAEIAKQHKTSAGPFYAIARTAVEEQTVKKSGSGYELAKRSTAPTKPAKRSSGSGAPAKPRARRGAKGRAKRPAGKADPSPRS